MPDIADQYRIIAAGAGWRRQAERGRLRFTGTDRASFLQALVTNEVQSLRPGSGVYAAYLTPTGRMITDLHLYVREDQIVADVPSARAGDLAAKFDQLIFSEDVNVADVSAELPQLMVIGAQAARAISAATSISIAQLDSLPVHGNVAIADGFVARSDAAGDLTAFVVVLSAAAELPFTAALAEAGVLAMDDALFDAIRVNAGRPAFGIDMDETTIPLEAGLLERAISTTKGCYVGQEIVIRVLHRGGGRVAKRLARLKFASGARAPERGQKISADGKEVGEITSVAPATAGDGWLALGYLHRDSAEAGRRVSTDAGDAEVVALVT
jgi:folate-binding protein YgfZ